MATTKTLTPTNQAITIAAFTEKPDNRVNATNDDKLADAVNALNSNSMMKHGIVNSIASDTAILNYDPGTYQIALSASSTYVPDRYGTLTVLDSGDVYKSFIFVKTATNTMYNRVGHKTNGTWYGDWNEVATTSKLPSIVTGRSFSVTTNNKGMASVESENIPSVSGRTRAIVVLGNFTSNELSTSQIPPSVVQTSGNAVYILGTPNKTYSSLQLTALFI